MLLASNNKQNNTTNKFKKKQEIKPNFNLQINNWIFD